MTIKQQGGVFGRHPSFESIELNGQDLQTELDGKADLTGDTFTGQVNVNVPTTGGVTVTSTGNCEIVAARTAGASVRMQAQSAAGTLGTTSNHRFDLLSNGSARLRIETNADVNVLSGNLIIGTSGKGIDFSATSGTGTSELFDDYEEGTWTPTFSAEFTTAPTVTSAQYTKIGRQVTVTMLAVGGVVTAGGGIGGLPFASNSTQGSGAYGGSTDTTLSLQGTVGQSALSITNIPARVLTGSTWQITATYFTT